jgi:hypothetical protein
VPERPADPAAGLRARQVAAERAFAPVGPTVWAQIAAYCEASPRRAEPLLAWYALTQLQIAADGGAAAAGAGEVRPCRSAELQGRHRTTEWRRRRWAEEAGIARCSPPAPPARRWGPNARIHVELLYARGGEVVRIVREQARARRPGKAERSTRTRPGPPTKARPPAEPGELARRAAAALERDLRAAREREAQAARALAPQIAALLERARRGVPERAHAPPAGGEATTT